MSDPIPYGSICSGMEMAAQALEPIGFECVFTAEIEAFPCAVMAHRQRATRPRNLIDPSTMPTEKERLKWEANNREIARMADRGEFGNRVVNEGDFTKINAADYRHIKLLIGGPPCQAFSIAGARKGLADHRGNLTLAYVDFVHALFATGSLRIAVYENVPGLLSDKKNAFGCFLAAAVGHDAPIVSPHGKGRWTDVGVVVGPRARAAWRVLDSQHFGLAQRRRRVFVVICPLDGPDPVAILLEPKGLFRAAAPSDGARKDLAPTLGARTAGGGGLGTDAELDGDDGTVELGDRVGLPSVQGGQHGLLGATDLRVVRGGATDLGRVGLESGQHCPVEETAGTLLANGKAAGSATSQDASQGLLVPVAYQATGDGYWRLGLGLGPLAASDDNGCNQAIVAAFPITADALRGEGLAKTPSADAGGAVRLRNPSLGIGQDGDPASTLQAGTPPAVAYSIMPMNSGKDFKARETDVAQPVMAGGPVGGNQGGDYIVQPIGFQAIGQSEYAEDVAPLRAKGGDFGGGSETIIAFDSRQELVSSISVFGALGASHPQAQAQAVCYAPELSPTLKADGFDGSEDGSEDGSGRRALVAHAFSVRGRDGEAQIEPEASDVAPAVRTGGGGSSKSFVATVDGAIRWAVRRLMPPECETLQGSAINYTRIPWRGRPAEECPDGPRYKVLGNSFSRQVIEWLGLRCHAAIRADETQRAAA